MKNIDLRPSKSQKGQMLRRIASALFLCLFIGAFLWVVPLKELWHVLINVQIMPLLASVLLLYPFIYLDAVQFAVMTRWIGMPVTVLEVMEINTVMRFYQTFVPGTAVSSALRLYRFSNLRNQPSESLAAMAYDRALDVFLVILFGGGFLLISAQDAWVGLTQFFLLILVSFSIWLSLPYISLWLYPWALRLTEKVSVPVFVGRVAHGATHALHMFSTYRTMPLRQHVIMISLGTLAQLAGLISYYFLTLAISLQLPIADVGWLRAAMLLAAYLPVNFTPILGVREASAVAILMSMGIAPEKAAAFALLVLFRSLVLGGVGGLVEIARNLQRWARKEVS